MVRYLSKKWTVFREHSSRKTVSSQEQIASKDKYPSIFCCHMEVIVFIIIPIFLEHARFWKLGNILGYNRFSPIVRKWKYSMDYKLGYLSSDIICSSKLTVFLKLHSQKTVRFLKQIMSVDKYPSIFFVPSGGYCLYPMPNGIIVNYCSLKIFWVSDGLKPHA